MKQPTIVFDSGYASRLPNGSIQVQRQEYLKLGEGGSLMRRETSVVTIPKSDAEKLARFILEK